MAVRARDRERRPGIHARLELAVCASLRAHGVDDANIVAAASALPRKWEKLGDLVLVPARASSSPLFACDWGTATSSSPRPHHAPSGFTPEAVDSALAAIAEQLTVSRIGIQAAIEPSLHRKSNAQILWPRGCRDGWVQHREAGIVYCFDVQLSMFASGNGTERMRVAHLAKPGEIIADLYAGIGYFTIPFLAKAGAAYVHACEWDLDTVAALRKSLHENGVQHKCTVHEGDNKDALSAFEGQVHRVNLGLIPSSETGWAIAVRALRDEGGWMHVHANVAASPAGHAAFCERLERVITSLAVAAGRKWDVVTVVHLERVKKYAPRVDHVVADVRLAVAPWT